MGQQLRQRPDNRVMNSAPANNSASANASVSQQAIRCYNCSGSGHISASCPAPRRERGSCFTCGSMQHVHRDCPQRLGQRANNSVAMIDGWTAGTTLEGGFADEANNEAISEVNRVSVTFLLDCTVNVSSNSCVSLFDTGSPVNLIRFASVPQQLVNAKLQPSEYSGIGKFRLCTNGEIEIKVKFKGRETIAKILIVPNNCIPYEMILGRNTLRLALRSLGINLTFSNNIPKPIVDVEYVDTNKIRIENQVLHCIYSSFRETNSDFIYSCNLCQTLPNTCMVRCDSSISVCDDNIDQYTRSILSIEPVLPI